MSDEWNRVGTAREDFSEPARSSPSAHAYDLSPLPVESSGIPARLITLFFASMALVVSACTSEDTPMAPVDSPSLAQATRGYVAVDLGTLGGSFSEARAINPAGQVVGVSTTAAGETHAFLWSHGMMTDLGTLNGGSSRAFDINSAGEIVGESQAASQ